MWIGKKYSLNDLKKFKSEKIKRNEFKILIIDDKDLNYGSELSDHQYYFNHVHDIDSINYVSEYQIIICDIKGVGKKFNSKFEGAHIINEIDRQYPNKIKIAYTGNEFDIRYNQFFELCDAKIHKDDDFDTWIDILDDAINKVADPIDQWKRVRERLLNNDVPIFDIFCIEQDYIKSIVKKSEKYLKNSNSLNVLNDDLKQIVLSIFANGIFKLIVGI
eukprot:Anaeramoba_ignava/a2393_9.p2 GENE.a2393_9~~a2393_9.p2  ORF type:complete len:218 (-),score=19.99 a2393_9:575-1228(-)